jgi:hypothetical protein
MGAMRLVLPVVLVMMVLGCSGKKGPAIPRVEPPQLATPTRPDLRLPTTPGRQGVIIDLRLDVLIAANGQPDFSTIRLSGLGASENQSVIEQWLRTARFRPATQAGVPVAAMYHGAWRVEARTTIRRQLE